MRSGVAVLSNGQLAIREGLTLLAHVIAASNKRLGSMAMPERSVPLGSARPAEALQIGEVLTIAVTVLVREMDRSGMDGHFIGSVFRYGANSRRRRCF